MSYQEAYRHSIEDPAGFWGDKADLLPWFRQPTTMLATDDQGIDRWFVDGEMNTAYCALDWHVEQGRGNQTALIYDSPVTNQVASFTYAELREQVALTAGMLAARGVAKGDRVLLYMPMIPEAAIAMLACARLGAIHSVVFGGFAAHELAVRINDADPKLILTASCGIEIDRVIAYKPLVDDAIEQAVKQPETVIVLQRPQQKATLQAGRDLDWAECLEQAQPAGCVPVLATDPLYILYTSGTTGTPKGIVRDNGGHAVAMKYSMQAVYGIEAGDVYWAASDVGWVVGHSYIVYAPLLAGCTTILYEGKPVRTPDAGAFWRVIEQHQVKAVFSAPTAFRAIRKEDPNGDLIKRYDLSCLKSLFLAGERLDPPTYHWLKEQFERPVIDHWWQTETGWAIAGNPVGIEAMPTKAGSATKPTTGFDVRILNADGDEVGPGEQGIIAVKLPLPPSCLPTVWNNHERFVNGYLGIFPGYYVSGDGGYFDDEGYLYVMGRTDDIINVAGHRLSTGEMEEIAGAHSAVAECAVIGVHCELKGQVPVALAIVKDGIDLSAEQLQVEVVEKIRHEIGAITNLKQVLMVKRLPKTRSGKILRATMRKIADGESYTVPSTIDDPASLDEIAVIMQQQGVGSFAVNG